MLCFCWIFYVQSAIHKQFTLCGEEQEPWGAAVPVPLCWPCTDQHNECVSDTRGHVDDRWDLNWSDKEGGGRADPFGGFCWCRSLPILLINRLLIGSAVGDRVARQQPALQRFWCPLISALRSGSSCSSHLQTSPLPVPAAVGNVPYQEPFSYSAVTEAAPQTCLVCRRRETPLLSCPQSCIPPFLIISLSWYLSSYLKEQTPSNSYL